MHVNIVLALTRLILKIKAFMFPACYSALKDAVQVQEEWQPFPRNTYYLTEQKLCKSGPLFFFYFA